MEHYCIHDPAGHPLAEVNESEEFQCDGCKTPGNGTRYRCHKCDFNFHDYCRRCPSTLSTFMHHQHNLELVTGPHPQASRNNHDQSFCDLCNDNVEGLFYSCKICDFDIHPLCTQLPEYVPHVLHPDHKLMLHKSSPGWCRVCESKCTSWRYGCRTCSFDIHLECILARCNVSTTTASRSVPPFYGPNSDTRYGPYGPGHYGADRPTHYETYEPIHSGHYRVQYPYQSSTPHPHTHYGPYGPVHYGPGHYGADRPTHYDAYEPTHSGHYGVQYPYVSSTPHPHTHYGPYGPSHYGPGHYGADRPTHYDAYEPTHSGHYGVQYLYHSSTPHPLPYSESAPGHYGVQYLYHSSTPHPSPYYQSAPAAPTLSGAYIHPPPSYGATPPTYGAHVHGEHPPGFIPHSASHSLTVSEGQENGNPLKWGKRLGKIIFSLVTNLASGLLLGVIFGI